MDVNTSVSSRGQINKKKERDKWFFTEMQIFRLLSFDIWISNPYPGAVFINNLNEREMHGNPSKPISE